MSRKPAHARHRVDTTSKALTAEAKRLGVDVEPLGGTVDALLFIGRVIRLVEWKSESGTLQPSQIKLVARGCPVHFVSSVEQLHLLVKDMRREAYAG